MVRLVKICAALLGCALLSCGGAGPSTDVIITRAELQQRVEPRFPVLRRILMTDLRLDHPEILLRQGSDAIGIRCQLSVKLPVYGEKTGTLAASGKLSYSQPERAFYLSEPTVDTMEIDGLKPELHAQIVSLLKPTLTTALATLPVYTLKGRNTAEKAAAHVLQNVVVRDGTVVATLALL
jgi:hypothetical protein